MKDETRKTVERMRDSLILNRDSWSDRGYESPELEARIKALNEVLKTLPSQDNAKGVRLIARQVLKWHLTAELGSVSDNEVNELAEAFIQHLKPE